MVLMGLIYSFFIWACHYRYLSSLYTKLSYILKQFQR